MLLRRAKSAQPLAEQMNMTRLFLAVCLVGVLCLFMAGCASEPTYSSVQAKIPAVAPGNSRVFIYRKTGQVPDLGNLIGLGQLGQLKVDVLIDGQRVGQADPGRMFFVDLPPGMHSVGCDVQITTFRLVAGESRYVSLELYTSSSHQHLQPILVHPDQGSQEISGLHYNAMVNRGSTDTAQSQPSAQTADLDSSGHSIPFVLKAGQSIVLSAGQSAKVPAGTIVHDANVNTITLNGHQNTVTASSKVRITVPRNATGESDNLIIAN
jgi:hypothetical protein